MIVAHLLALAVLASRASLGAADASSEARAGELFARGVAAYGERRYSDAAAQFEEIRKLGLESGEVDYDLGSAYYRLGDVGRAILNFRRAERFFPRDPDLKENLAMALERAKERAPGAGDLPWQKAYAAFRQSLSLAEEKMLFLSAYTLAALALLGSIFALRAPLRRVGMGLGVIAILLGASYLTRLHDERSRPPAVALAAEIDVRTGPGEDYSVHFVVHAGAEFRVVEVKGEWSKIAISADRKGWLRSSTIGHV